MDTGDRQVGRLLLELAASRAPMLFQTRDRDLYLTFLTGGLIDDLRIDAAAALGTKFEVLPGTGEPDHPIVRAHRAALQGRPSEPVRFEMRERCIEARVSPLYGESGAIAGTVSVWFDVTEAQRTERLLRQHFLQIELAADSTPSVFWVVDADGTLTTLSGRALEVLGWDAQAMLGKSLPEALRIAGNRDPARAQRLLAPLRTGIAVSYESRWDERAFMLHVKPVLEPDGRISGAVGIAYDVTEQKQAQEECSYLATHDVLTRLPNRALLKELLSRGIEHSKEQNKYAAVIAIDIDRFNQINDAMGLEAGDGVLTQAARRLEAAAGRATAARVGGDEFVVVASMQPDLTALSELAQRLLGVFDEPFDCGEREIFLRASAGVSVYPSDGEGAETLLMRAESAMQGAKQRGGSNVQFFHSDFQSAAAERVQLETDLRCALDRGQLLLYYQPIIDIRTRRLTGAEALLRWQHPQRGLLSPDAFIYLAEQTALIVPIGEWVLEEACKQAADWSRYGPLEFVSVNVCARQLAQSDLPHAVLRARERARLRPGQLELEFTESALMADAWQGIAILKAIRDSGVRISVDDFGTGYSSLAYLKQLPIDTMKIDRLFVRDIATSPYDAAIARAIIALAQSIDLRVIAEGVETVEQLNLLEALECELMQGYYFSKPVPAEHFAQYFNRRWEVLPLSG